MRTLALKNGSASDISTANRLDELWSKILHITNSARYRMPYEMISGHCSISSNFFSFLTRNVLFHPLPGGVRYQDKRAPVMDINETFISRGRDNQKPFRLITTLKRSASDRGHEDWLAFFTVDEIGLLLVSFTLPFKPAIGKADRPTVLPKRFKHPAAGCGLNPGINQWRFIPPPWRVTPVNRIELQLYVAFAQK
ncbi:hypothetical protein F8B39_05316 (plasmid) [Klebsiella pneumoniae]|nr:hypothetical protein F8B39_05316 [Klebsiella pneumoniae]